MSYKAIVTRLKNVRPHGNADRVKLATCVGNQVVIGLDSEDDELGVYFPSDGQLSHEFCYHNSIYRDSSLNLDPKKTGMFDINRRVRAQRFRGEISDGFWVPLSNFDFLGKIVWVEGFEFEELNGTPICSKYINPATLKIARENQGKKTKAAKTSVMFKEHFDTAHFGKEAHRFDFGQTIVVTEKLHGTSGRVGHVLVERENLSLVERIAKFFGAKIQESEWKYLNGTRRVVLEESSGSQFHDPTIRDKAFKLFEGNLRKGETVFFEIVGYESTGAFIMPSVDTERIGDKEFVKTYGKSMAYTYGCAPTECKVFVYRMTMTDTDGHSVDYSWEDVVKRCKEIGVDTVPHIRTLSFEELREADMKQGGNGELRDLKEQFSKMVEEYGAGPSVIDGNHIKEGVCVRIEGGLNNQTMKFKSFEFKVLEGILKDAGVVDTEEAQG